MKKRILREMSLFCLVSLVAISAFAKGPYVSEKGGSLTDADTTVVDQGTGLTWQRKKSPTVMSWSATAKAGSAQAYCQGSTTGQHSDWRLPTLGELSTLEDLTVARHPKSKVFLDTGLDLFWTSSPTPTTAWIVLFNTDRYRAPTYSVGFYYSVRCCR